MTKELNNLTLKTIQVNKSQKGSDSDAISEVRNRLRRRRESHEVREILPWEVFTLKLSYSKNHLTVSLLHKIVFTFWLAHP